MCAEAIYFGLLRLPMRIRRHTSPSCIPYYRSLALGSLTKYSRKSVDARLRRGVILRAETPPEMKKRQRPLWKECPCRGGGWGLRGGGVGGGRGGECSYIPRPDIRRAHWVGRTNLRNAPATVKMRDVSAGPP